MVNDFNTGISAMMAISGLNGQNNLNCRMSYLERQFKIIFNHILSKEESDLLNEKSFTAYFTTVFL